MHPTIFGIQGDQLLDEEKLFFEKHQPLGFILFERNCKNPEQLQSLIQQLTNCVHHTYVPILIDQEGGRVVRLRPPHWRSAFPAAIFGDLANTDLEAAKKAVYDHSYLIGIELQRLGITVNCSPCADIFYPKADGIIGDRAFSGDVDITVALCVEAIRGFLEAGILPIIKHLPGHGAAPVDSHKALPTVGLDEQELSSKDFEVFRKICDVIHQNNWPYPWGMTAHVVYQDIDPSVPATHSPTVIKNIIRKHINFNGPIITDDLTMEALTGSMQQRAQRSLIAGCDILLHCGKNFDEVLEIAEVSPLINPDLWQRVESDLMHVQSMCNLSLDAKAMEENVQSVVQQYQLKQKVA